MKWVRPQKFLSRLRTSVRRAIRELRRSGLVKFTGRAFRLWKQPAFLALILTLAFLPPGNDYLGLRLTPRPPRLRPLEVTLPPPTPYPVRKEGMNPPNLSARSAIVIDVPSATVLYAKNPDLRLLPASTTKIMTAVVALNHYPLDRVIAVKRADRALGQTMNLIPGERLTVQSLLYGLLLASGNDAAFALAESFPGGYNAFVAEMNRMAQELELSDTQFRNVSGVEQDGHYTTVRDLARLAAVAMRNPTFSEIVSTWTAEVKDVSGAISHRMTNKNELLKLVAGVRGVKTGWTENAGECLVTDVVRDGREVIVVILGSQDRFGESHDLIEWTYAAHTWIDPGTSSQEGS